MGKDCAERVEKGVDSNGNPPFWVESCFDSAVSHQKNCLHCRNSHLRVCPQFKGSVPNLKELSKLPLLANSVRNPV